MTLFTFLGVKSHGWTFYDPIKINGLPSRQAKKKGGTK